MSDDNQRAAFVSSVRVEHKGRHDHVNVWIRGANVGTLVVGEGDGATLARLLQPGRIEAPYYNQAGEVIDGDAEVPGPSMSDAEAAAWRELKRRGLDLDVMNRARARSDMPILTAVETLKRIDAAAGALNDLRGMGFPEPYIPEPDRAPPERCNECGMRVLHTVSCSRGALNEALQQVRSEGEARARPVPTREQIQERLAQIRRLGVYHAQRDEEALRGHQRSSQRTFAQLIVDLCDADDVLPKPPLGVKPQWLWREERYAELCAAMQRYHDASEPPPRDLLDEVGELQKLIEQRTTQREHLREITRLGQEHQGVDGGLPSVVPDVEGPP